MAELVSVWKRPPTSLWTSLPWPPNIDSACAMGGQASRVGAKKLSKQ